MADSNVLIVRQTPEAVRDLEGIWLYSMQTWSVEQADAYIESLDQTFSLLAVAPFMARERHEFSPPVRAHAHQSHVIIYRLVDGFLDIIRVVHMRQNWAALLGE